MTLIPFCYKLYSLYLNALMYLGLNKTSSISLCSAPSPEVDCAEEPRVIRMEREPPSTPLGITAIGGNSVGVFISDIQKNSLVELQGGLKCGDQIIKVLLSLLCYLFFIALKGQGCSSINQRLKPVSP